MDQITVVTETTGTVTARLDREGGERASASIRRLPAGHPMGVLCVVRHETREAAGSVTMRLDDLERLLSVAKRTLRDNEKAGGTSG